MNMIRNNAKRKKLLKRNKKINERKRDNIPTSTNLFFNIPRMVLGGIFILCFVYDFEGLRDFCFRSPLFAFEYLQLVIKNIIWHGTISVIEGVLLSIG